MFIRLVNRVCRKDVPQAQKGTSCRKGEGGCYETPRMYPRRFVIGGEEPISQDRSLFNECISDFAATHAIEQGSVLPRSKIGTRRIAMMVQAAAVYATAATIC
jgi:hypothetical protein